MAWSLFMLLLPFVFVILRLQNIGHRSWYSLLLLIPLVNLFLIAHCTIAPPGYWQTKKMDVAGILIACVLIVIFIVVVLYSIVSSIG